MWEQQRIDGKKKLKSCAIPTIFSQKTSINIAQVDSISTNVSVLTVLCNNFICGLALQNLHITNT